MKKLFCLISSISAFSASADRVTIAKVVNISTYSAGSPAQVFREIGFQKANDRNTYGLQIPVKGNNAVLLEDCYRGSQLMLSQPTGRSMIIDYSLDANGLPILSGCYLR